MTLTQPDVLSPKRTASPRAVLMCRPEHFTVAYRINPWMHPENPTDTSLAVQQWESLHAAYLDLGFDVHLIDAVAGLPDMVYAANGGFVLDGVAYGVRFTHPERAPEGPVYMDWFERAGFDVRVPEHSNEGEGDFLLVGDTILAGSGFRSTTESHRELGRVFGREVIGLELINPSFYHLDTALAVLDPDPAPGTEPTIAYLPSAFSEASLAVLRERFPTAIIVSEADAAVLGLNCFSDGCTVVVASRAFGFAQQLRDRGFTTVAVDLSELLLGGGGIKCCTLELRR